MNSFSSVEDKEGNVRIINYCNIDERKIYEVSEYYNLFKNDRDFMRFGQIYNNIHKTITTDINLWENALLSIRNNIDCASFYYLLLYRLYNKDICNKATVCSNNAFYNLYCAKVFFYNKKKTLHYLNKFKRSLGSYDAYIKKIYPYFQYYSSGLKPYEIEISPEKYLVYYPLYFDLLFDGFKIQERRVLFNRYKDYIMEHGNKLICGSKNIDVTVFMKIYPLRNGLKEYRLIETIRAEKNNNICFRTDGIYRTFVTRRYRKYYIPGLYSMKENRLMFNKMFPGKRHMKSESIYLYEDLKYVFIVEPYYENDELYVCKGLFDINQIIYD